MTPATAKAKKAKISFTLHEYDHDPSIRAYGREAAEKLGVPEEQLFKTLVVSTGPKDLAVAVVPVSGQLDLKAFAKAMKVKKVVMADKPLVERTTGYLTGGVSPIGQKNPCPQLLTPLPESSISSMSAPAAEGFRSACPQKTLPASPGPGLSLSRKTVDLTFHPHPQMQICCNILLILELIRQSV